MACYDFPEIVIHSRGGKCPRYTGGICHPMPTPVEPYNKEEAEVVGAYNDAMAFGITGRLIKAAGATQSPAEEGRA